MDKYTVEFRIEGLSLIASEVSTFLNLQPAQVRKGNQLDKVTLWTFDGVSIENDFIEQEWNTLEEGLSFLLDILESKLFVLESKLSTYKRYFWCAHFQESFNGGPIFSPALLKRLASFKTEVILKNHYIE